MPNSQLRSPNEMFDKAKEIMLDGREPQSDEDWCRIVNFWAYNIADGLEQSACKLMCMIYDCPLNEMLVAEIAIHQQTVKRREKKSATETI